MHSLLPPSSSCCSHSVQAPQSSQTGSACSLARGPTRRGYGPVVAAERNRRKHTSEAGAVEPRPDSSAWAPPHGSWASSAANRKSMQGNKSRDTTPELAIRRLLHAAGLWYRVNRSPLKDVRRRADIVFGPAKVAVVIDGCYWHACPEHYVPPKTNPAYWGPKISGNVARDRDTDARLIAAGWAVLRFWEHESAEECSAAIAAVVQERLASAATDRRSQQPELP